MSSAYEEYMIEIPLVPEVAAKILQINENSKPFTTEELTRLISLDPYLTASILKIANSALYSRRSEITGLHTAITLIGFKKIKTMVLLLAGASLFKKNDNALFYHLFWQHSIISAFVCREIVILLEKEELKDEYFTAALIHRIGEVPLYLSDTAKYLNLIEDNRDGEFTLCSLENEMFKVNSCEIGGALLKYWNFPESLIKAAQYSNTDTTSTDLLVDIITISDCITVQMGFGIPEYIELEKLNKLLQIINLHQKYYDFLISEAFLNKLKKMSLFKECQKTLNIQLIPDN